MFIHTYVKYTTNYTIHLNLQCTSNNNNNSQAALSPHLEKPYILPGIKQKPADIYIPNWSRGEPLAMDITVVSPTQVHLLDYHHPQLCAAHWREEQKRKKYEKSLDAECVIFVPLAVESFGGWGTASIPIFKTLARMVANRSDQPVSSVYLAGYIKGLPLLCRRTMPVQ